MPIFRQTMHILRALTHILQAFAHISRCFGALDFNMALSEVRGGSLLKQLCDNTGHLPLRPTGIMKEYIPVEKWPVLFDGPKAQAF